MHYHNLQIQPRYNLVPSRLHSCKSSYTHSFYFFHHILTAHMVLLCNSSPLDYWWLQINILDNKSKNYFEVKLLWLKKKQTLGTYNCGKQCYSNLYLISCGYFISIFSFILLKINIFCICCIVLVSCVKLHVMCMLCSYRWNCEIMTK